MLSDGEGITSTVTGCVNGRDALSPDGADEEVVQHKQDNRIGIESFNGLVTDLLLYSEEGEEVSGLSCCSDGISPSPE